MRAWAVTGFCVVALALVYLYFWHHRRSAPASQKALAGLAAAGLIAYSAYYLWVGPSYQQWKFATYAVLPFCFVVFGAIVRLARHSRRPRLALTGLGCVGAYLVLGNLWVHARRDLPLVRLPATLRNVERVDSMPSFQELWLQMGGLFETYVAIYYLPSKRVHVVDDVFQPSEELQLEAVSPSKPLLIADEGCRGVGHDRTIAIPGAGCLVLAPPALSLGVSYPFSRAFAFIRPRGGMSVPEDWGRWNDGRALDLDVFVDSERTAIDEHLYVNLLLNPYIRPAVARQRVEIAWGSGRRASTVLTDREWIHLPVGPADWSGSRVRGVALHFELPDAVAPAAIEPGGADHRLLAVAFEELSVDRHPRGRAP